MRILETSLRVSIGYILVLIIYNRCETAMNCSVDVLPVARHDREQLLPLLSTESLTDFSLCKYFCKAS